MGNLYEPSSYDLPKGAPGEGPAPQEWFSGCQWQSKILFPPNWASQAARVRNNVVLFGTAEPKTVNTQATWCRNDASCRKKCRIFRAFYWGRNVDMVGVTGSIPVAPTIES